MKNENALYQIVCEDCNRPILNVDEDTIKSFKNLQSLYDELRNEREEAVELLRTAHIYVKGNIPAMIISGDIADFLKEIDGEE